MAAEDKKSLLSRVGSAFDSAISVFSPERAYRRECYRRLRERSAQYAAAKTSRLTGAWMPVDASINEILRGSVPQVRARIRQLVRDFPYFARAINIIESFQVGDGILLQSKVKTPQNTLNKKVNMAIEDAFKRWADEADISGRLHYYEMMQLAKRQDVECGEFVLVKRHSRARGRYLPYCLQMFEPDWLTDVGATPASKRNIVDQGVEYNANTGEPVAYHFTDPDGWGKTIRVKAENVIHKFKTLRPGQIRGISAFTPGVLLANELSEYMGAEVDAAKMAAKYMAFVQTPDPLGRQAATTVDPDSGLRIDEMENAIIEYLRPGETIEIATNPRPGSNFPPFVKLVLCMLSVATNVPYEILSGDYSGVNYTTLRTSRNDFAQLLRPEVKRHVRHFAMPTYISFLESAVLHGKLSLPGFFSDPYPYIASEWHAPGMESIDPLRETKARISEMYSLMRSPQEVTKARGRDFEEVVAEIAEAKNIANEYGVDFEQVNQNMANSPGAVEDQ